MKAVMTLMRLKDTIAMFKKNFDIKKHNRYIEHVKVFIVQAIVRHLRRKFRRRGRYLNIMHKEKLKQVFSLCAGNQAR